MHPLEEPAVSNHLPFSASVTVSALLALAGSAQGQQFQAEWLTDGGNYNVTINWSTPLGGVVPLNSGGTTWDLVFPIGLECIVNVSTTIDRGAADPGALLSQLNARTVNIVSDPTNGGNGSLGRWFLVGATHAMNSLGNTTDIVAAGDPGTLFIQGSAASPGLLLMSDNTQNRIFGSTINHTIVFDDITVSGAGQIGLNQTGVVSGPNAVIEASSPLATLTLDPDNSAGWNNSGSLFAVSGGALRLNEAPYDNFSGIIAAVGAGSTVTLSGGDIDGGTTNATQGGTFELNSGTITNSTLQIEANSFCLVTGSATLDNLDNLGTINQNNNTSLRVSGTLVNTLYNMNSLGNTSNLFAEGDLLLTGGGEIVMNTSTQNRILGASNTDRLTNADNFIHGTGQIGVNQLKLTNQGVIEADDPDSVLIIDPFGDGQINTGVFRASGGGQLNINAAVYDQTPEGGAGLIEALEGSKVIFNDADIIGGMLDAAGSGVLEANPARFIGVQNNGAVVVQNADTLRLQDGFINAGSVDLNSLGNSTDIRLETSVALSGGGTIRMNGNPQARILATNDAFTLSNEDNLIQGQGQLGVNQTGIVNNSVILANDAGATLTVDPNAALGMVNNGMLRAADQATLRLNSGSYDNTNGEIRALDSAAVVLGSGADVTGGTIIADPGGFLEFNGGAVINAVPVVSAGAEGMITSAGGGAEDGLDNFGQIEALNNTSFQLGGVVSNANLIIMSSLGNNTDFEFIDDIVTLSGGGEIQMNITPQNRLRGADNSKRLVNVDNWIHGTGQVGLNQLQLTNQGVIEADNPSSTLTIDPAANATINTGVFRSSNGAILNINADTYDQTGEGTQGLIEALDGSTVIFNNADIIGGRLDTDGSGSLVANPVRLISVQNEGTVVVGNADALRLQDSFVNAGTVDLQSLGNTTSIEMETSIAISGGGAITMSDNTQNRILSTSNQLFTNVNNTISGAGQIGVDQTDVINQGVIEANAPVNALTLDPRAGGVFDNEGELRVTGAGGMVIALGPFTNLGDVFIAAGRTLDRQATEYTQTAGSTTVDGTLELDAGGDVMLQSGVLGGTGTVEASVLNPGGTVAPGSSAGTLTVQDAFDQSGGGTLSIELEGADPGQFDVLAVGATAVLGGTLEVIVGDGFTPSAGESFVVLTAAQVLESFDSVVTQNLPAGFEVAVFVNDDNVTVVLACGGDFNGDGALNILDFVAFQTAFQNQDLAADCNGDTLFNILDFVCFQADFLACE